MQAYARQTTPPKFNLNATKFNQNSTIEEFSCFLTTEPETSMDTWEIQSESEKEDTQSESYTGETNSENYLQSIGSITSNQKNPFSTWQPFIHQPTYRNSSAQSWWLVPSRPEYSSQEPTLTAISSINCSTVNTSIKPIPLPVDTIQINPQMKQNGQHSSRTYKPETKNYEHNSNKPWPELNRLFKTTKTLRTESLDHQEQFEPLKLWKQQSPFLTTKSKNQNTKWQIMPPEIDAGSAH
jgi:hypothetical protein